jgi:hypothetical protein
MLDQAQLQKIRDGGLLDAIRERPAMYMGERSLSALWHYLHGYIEALRFHDIVTRDVLPPDFHDWVAYRLHFYESTSGYRNMILKRVPDEAAALDRFFELLDDHRARKPHVVAIARSAAKNGRRQNADASASPSSLNLIAYSDDPGFFASSDDHDTNFFYKDRFFPTLNSLQLRLGVSKDDLTVLDPEIYNRWLAQEDRFTAQEEEEKNSPS